MTLNEKKLKLYDLGHTELVATHPSQFFVFEGQDASALCEELHFDHGPGMGGGEIALSSPSAKKKHNSLWNAALFFPQINVPPQKTY